MTQYVLQGTAAVERTVERRAIRDGTIRRRASGRGRFPSAALPAGRDDVEGDLGEPVAVATLQMAEEAPEDGHVIAVEENGHGNGAAPLLRHLDQPEGTIQRRLRCRAHVIRQGRLLQFINFLIKEKGKFNWGLIKIHKLDC